MIQGVGETDVATGVVAKNVLETRASTTDTFWLLFDDDPPSLYVKWFDSRSRLVDARGFVEQLERDSSVLYSAPIASDDSLLAAFDDQSVPNIEIQAEEDPQPVRPLDDASFWATIDLAEGAASEAGVARLEGHLSSKEIEFGLSFRAKLDAVIRDLPHDAVNLDSDRIRALAIVLRGRATLSEAVKGESLTLGESELAASALLERAIIAETTRNAALFVGAERPISYSGVRRHDAMVDAGLFPQIVGSRYLVTDGSSTWDNIAVQLIDPYSEKAPAVTHSLASANAARRGGSIASRVLTYYTHTATVFSGLPVFVSKRRIS